ncbi:MAG: DNA-binding protein [Clostridia bacterium]|nr:DNA-binding protein [Clostridia bacterium]
MSDIKVYTLDEVAIILKLTRRSVYNYIKEGRLQAFKIGKRWRVTEAELLKLSSIGTGPKA